MGLFSRTPKANPKITAQGIEIEFCRSLEVWRFSYRGIDFLSCETSLVLPSIAELDTLLATVEALMPEMKSRLRKGLAEWLDTKPDQGESFLVDIGNYATEGSIRVAWSNETESGGWGDMGADFKIKDRAIIDESWGD